MRVAHFAAFGPNACGLYHTAKDLILAERMVGIDARMIDPDKPGVHEDGSFKTEELSWAYGADVLVRHSSVPGHIQNSGIPIVMALHGRPESSYRLEEKKNPVLPAVVNKGLDRRYRAFVTFWPEYVNFWSELVGEVLYVPATVDLDDFRPVEKTPGPNVLVCDIWRDDVTPMNVLQAAVQFARRNGGKVNVAGLPQNQSVNVLLTAYRDVMGSMAGQTKRIREFYDRSDILATPHVIATRSMREALACGLKLTAGTGCRYTPFTANPMDVAGYAEAIEQCWKGQYDGRKVAEDHFALPKAGEAMKAVFEKVLAKTNDGRRKVLVDIGAHHGETVHRFYKEVLDAAEYDIYCFEPDLETFAELDRQVGHVKNVTLINAAAGTYDGMTTFFRGRQNGNEGGTTMPGKETGGVDYDKPVNVECVDFVRWLRANKGDVTVVKMNIEGAEYELMDHLLSKDATGEIDRLYVQLHAHKFQHGEQRQWMQQIEGRFWNEAKCKCYFKNKGFHAFERI